MKRKNNNRGFTLVELIIAVAILAIVIMPLISNFIQSSKMNLKGRKSLNAMNLAQDVMEGMSAFTASEVDKKMVDAMAATPTSLTGVLLPVDTTYTGVVKDASSTDNKRIYKISGVQTTTGAHNNYDMTVTVDATKTTHKYNTEEVASVAKIEEELDAICKITAAEETKAGEELNKLASPMVSNVKSAYNNNLSRTIDVIIKNIGTISAPVYTVEVNRTYTVKSSALTALGFPAGSVQQHYIASNNISPVASSEVPRSVYLFFDGISGATVADTETINVKNDTGKDVTVYLIRTLDNSVTPDATYNESYKCKVNVVSTKQTVDAFGNITTTNSENVKIVSNLRHNLTKPAVNNYRVYKEGSVSEKVDNIAQYETDSAGNAITSFYSSTRATYTYNSATPMVEADYKKLIFDGYERQVKNILYEVTLEIYEAGKTERVATYTGGISE